MKMLHPHRLQLAIDSFNTLAIKAQVKLVSTRVGCHVAATNGHKTNTTSRQNGSGIGVRDVALVSKHRRTIGQDKSQFMNGGQVLLGGRQEVKIDRDALRRANQMQAPAKELFAFGCTIATIGFATYLLAARGAGT